MYQAAVFAVILFVNGVQIPMSAPAVVEGETTWIPVRAVFEELGWEVRWDDATKSIQITAPNQPEIRIQIGNPKVRIGTRLDDFAAAPRRRDGVTYIPASLLKVIPGVQMWWDNEQKALYVEAVPVGRPIPVEMGELTANPPGWLNEVVIITGEYTGWQGNPFSPATSQGPPVTRSDWTVRDATGSIYCTGDCDTPGECPISLMPYEDYGRRITVTGAVRLALGGYPYLEPTAVAPVSGLAGLTCFVSTDRRQYQPGDTTAIQMTVANPFPQPVTLQFTSGQTYDLIIRDAKGNKVWQWSDGKVFTTGLTSRELKVAESYHVSARWTVPTGDAALAPGLYRVYGLVNADVSAYPHTIAIAGQD